MKVADVVREDRTDWTIEQKLEARIIDGDRENLTDDLDEALAGGRSGLSIVNDVLLAGMKTVGELFGSGQMQLPFVLQSAETMKASVAHLEPTIQAESLAAGGGKDAGKGRLVLATVKGDVHDIGKNLVDIILTNNGYEVHNLGIKISVSEMIEKALEVDADAIGMSGLLVKSTLIMRENLEELNSRNLVEDPGAARRRRAHPHVRRARPPRGVRGSALLRQGRLRGPPRDGPAQRAEAVRRGGPRVGSHARRTRHPQAREARRSTRRPSRPARPRSAPTTRCSCPRSSAPRS